MAKVVFIYPQCNLQTRKQEIEQMQSKLKHQHDEVIQQQEQLHQQLLHLAVQQQLEQQNLSPQVAALNKAQTVQSVVLSVPVQQPVLHQKPPHVQPHAAQGTSQSRSHQVQPVGSKTGLHQTQPILPGLRLMVPQQHTTQSTVHHYPQAAPLLAQVRAL